MLSFSQGYEHLPKQFLDPEDFEWRNIRLFQKPNDTKANQLVEGTDE